MCQRRQKSTIVRANNHTGDYGALGVELTTKYVAETGIMQAGVGLCLAEAREAKLLETAKARVALISISTSFAGIDKLTSRRRPTLPDTAHFTQYLDGSAHTDTFLSCASH